MKSKLIFLLLFAIYFAGCVPKSDYEELERELEKTKRELAYIKNQYEILLEEKRLAEVERNKKPYITEAQALQYIKDYYDFYERDMIYRNVQLRRIADNSFRVSLEICTKKGSFSSNNFFWTSSVRTLTVYNNGKYDF